ncbi:MAG: hypothetical protein ACXWTN_10310 [Methylosarcina sp.]
MRRRAFDAAHGGATHTTAQVRRTGERNQPGQRILGNDRRLPAYHSPA